MSAKGVNAILDEVGKILESFRKDVTAIRQALDDTDIVEVRALLDELEYNLGAGTTQLGLDEADGIDTRS